MIVKIRATTVQEMDIDPCEAFRILCRTLDMDCETLANANLFVKEKTDGELGVYYRRKDYDFDELYDDRGELFQSLRNLAEQLK